MLLRLFVSILLHLLCKLASLASARSTRPLLALLDDGHLAFHLEGKNLLKSRDLVLKATWWSLAYPFAPSHSRLRQLACSHEVAVRKTARLARKSTLAGFALTTMDAQAPFKYGTSKRLSLDSRYQAIGRVVLDAAHKGGHSHEVACLPLFLGGASHVCLLSALARRADAVAAARVDDNVVRAHSAHCS